MTREDIAKDPTLHLHHTAYTMGYVSRKADVNKLPAIPYKGRFGTGYTVTVPCMLSTQYAIKEYYIMEEVTP